MKYILIIICFFSITSCIQEKNLYQEKNEETENEKEVNSTHIYMYPFNKEVEDIEMVITIHTNKNLNGQHISTDIPHLKYNKSWLLMLTQDGCKQAAFCRTWAVINGKPISSSTPYPIPTATNPNQKQQLYFDIKHLIEGDLPPTIIPADKSLGFTDGTGNEIRFAITTTIAPEEKWMEAKTDVKLGFTENYYRFYMKSGLVWDNIREMLNFGTSIALHDVKATDVNDPTQILEHLNIAQNMIIEKLDGRGCKFLAEPNGNKTYITAAIQHSEIQTITAQTEAITLYPFQVSDDLQKKLIQRTFNDPAYFKQQIVNQLQLPKEKRQAICIGVHGTDNNWTDFLRWLNDNYGKDGDDSLWFPSQEEYYEYNYYRIHGKNKVTQIDEKTFKITVSLPGDKFFYYPSTTINVRGINMQDIVSLEGDETVSGLSYGEYEDGITLNIDCRKHLADHAKHFVELYETDPSNGSNKADALYFVNMLKNSALKTGLLKRIN